MTGVPRLTFHVARLGAIVLLLVGCSTVTDAGDAPVLVVFVGDETTGSVDATSWCRTSMGVDACVAADGAVLEFDVACAADVQIEPVGQGWRLVESNVLVEESGGRWSIGAAEGDVLVDMDAPSMEASWFFIIRRANC